MGEILKCNNSNESCRAVRYCGAVYYAVQDGSTSDSVPELLSVTIQVKVNQGYFPAVLFVYQYFNPVAPMSAYKFKSCRNLKLS